MVPAPKVDDSVFEPTPAELDHQLSTILAGAVSLRVYDRTGRSTPARNQRSRTPPSLLTDLTDPDVIAGIAAALGLRHDCEIMAWMTWPDLWLEFAGQHGQPLALLGWIIPDWVRWEPHGDIELLDPASLEEQLKALGVQMDPSDS